MIIEVKSKNQKRIALLWWLWEADELRLKADYDYITFPAGTIITGYHPDITDSNVSIIEDGITLVQCVDPNFFTYCGTLFTTFHSAKDGDDNFEEDCLMKTDEFEKCA